MTAAPPRRPPSIRVLVVDDQAIVRRGVRALLDTEPDLHVVGEAGDGAEAVRLVERLHPDVTLMDLAMPGMDGLEAIRLLAERGLGSRIIVLTSFATDENVFPSIKAGALGYLLKDSEPEDLVRAIRQVHRGEPSLHPEIARKVLLELNRPAERPQPRAVDPLTSRELDVLRLVARGLSNQDIATQLVLGETTVRTHVSSILGKLQLASRTQAALYALREGHATLDDAHLPE
jgi:two-component system, NarL family, response regulator LiaR